MYNKEDYIRIKAEFSQKYLRARERADERRLELYAAIPAVRALDREMASTGLAILAALGEGEDTEARVAEIRARNEALQTERRRLLRENGFAEDYSEIRYDCPACGDTGFLDGAMCGCMRRALVEAGYESSGLGGLIRTQSFENFSVEYYREGGDPQRMQAALAGMRRFAEEFSRDSYHNYLLMGGTGLGKTHLSTAVAKTVIERGYDVLYVTAVSLLRDYNAKQFDKGEGMMHDPARYREAELLIIDDLGTEVSNQFTLSCLYELINHRINNRLCTLINTNLSFREMESRYSERITSRLLGEYAPILFKGVDIRRQKIKRG